MGEKVRNTCCRVEQLRAQLPPIDEGRLKLLAVAVMFLDHAACAFLERALTAEGAVLWSVLPNGLLLDRVVRAIGRQSFPIFCFFLVEGFRFTGSRMKYFLRLLVFAVLSQIPFQKALFPRSNLFHASVMTTLAIGLLAIWAVEELKKIFDDGSSGGRALFFLSAGGSVCGFCRLAQVLHSDYSYGGIIVILILYLFRECRILSFLISWVWLSWYNRLELYSAPAFLLLSCYNGKRGKQRKYFFYIFYPAHLLFLWLLRRYFFGE